MPIFFAMAAILSGIWEIHGTYKKKKWLVDPEKFSKNILEHSQYIGKNIVGSEMLIIGNYVGGAMAIITGLEILFLEYIF